MAGTSKEDRCVTEWLWMVAGMGMAGALVAIRRASALTKELHRLRQEQREAGSKLAQLAEELRATTEPLRVHLATVAGGGTVPKELVLSNRLYVTGSVFDAQQQYDAAGGESGHIIVVDVRTPREYAVKRVKGAKLVPLEDLEQRYHTDIPIGAARVFVYCANGERSRLACEFLSRKGYTNLYHIRDGFQRWNGPTEGEGPLTLIQIERTH